MGSKSVFPAPHPHYLFPTPARALASRRPFLFSRLHPWQVTILQTLHILAVLQATISKAFLRIHSNANILRKIKLSCYISIYFHYKNFKAKI